MNVSRRTRDYFRLFVTILRLFGELRRRRIGSWRRRILQGRRLHGCGFLYLIHSLLCVLCQGNSRGTRIGRRSRNAADMTAD